MKLLLVLTLCVGIIAAAPASNLKSKVVDLLRDIIAERDLQTRDGGESNSPEASVSSDSAENDVRSLNGGTSNNDASSDVSSEDRQVNGRDLLNTLRGLLDKNNKDFGLSDAHDSNLDNLH